jgi:hypothetical protein
MMGIPKIMILQESINVEVELLEGTSPSLGAHSPRGPGPQEQERELRPSTRISRK